MIDTKKEQAKELKNGGVVMVSGVERGNNVYKRIGNIQQAINTVIKGGFNEHFKYKFARERDVVAEVKPLLGKEGLVVTHSLIKEEEVPHGMTSSGAPKFLTKLTFEFRITNVNDRNDFVLANAIGYGQDGEDKGAPKAYTMALKYFFAKQFLIETGDDAEEEKGGKKGSEKKESPEVLFAKAAQMIKTSNNLEGLLEYIENLKNGKTFNAKQKEDLSKLVSARVDALQNAQ